MSLSPSARRVQGALEARGFGHLKVVEHPASTRTATCPSFTSTPVTFGSAAPPFRC